MNRKSILSLLVLTASLPLLTYTSAQTSEIPAWVKNVAGFWSEDAITDQEFLDAVQYLIDNGILSDSKAPTNSSTITPDVGEEITSQEESEERVQLSANLDLTTFKVIRLQELAAHPDIVKAVIDSNAKFKVMDDPYAYITEKDADWKKQPKKENSPIMNALIENSVSKILKSSTVIPTEKFGDILFPEIIITNAYGANVAITDRTDDYNQGDEIWWVNAKDRVVHFRDTLWDESAGIFSADIIVQITDEKGNFIGVLNAATPVR